MIVTLEHLRTIPGFGNKPGFCSRGGRDWFAAHGLDWNAFRKEGIEAERLVATGDGLALALVAHAQRMEAIDGRRR